MIPSVLLALLPAVASAQSADQSFLGESILRENQVQNVLEHQPAKGAECQHVPTGPIEMTQCNYESIESVSDDLYNNLHDLVSTPFFRYFRADLYRECPFWNENGFCMNRQCGITTVDESEIPEKWRAASLSKVELPPPGLRNSLPGCYYKDTDYCFLDDHSEGDYVDLIANPEQFTGYAGISANRIWSTIYNENCFGISELDLKGGTDGGIAPATSGADPFDKATLEEPAQCLEKRVYYKIVSGLHTSISIHLCHDWFNQTSGEWMPNLQCFVSRVASHPERLKYVYFNTVLLLRAISRLGPYLSAYDYCSCNSETHEEDKFTLSRLNSIIDIAKNVGQFDETTLFKGENANIVKEEFKTHFRNVSRIMDCVGCDKCRLWGKVQTSGVATALKVLFEMDEKALDPAANTNLLTRSEVVALINTLHRFTESLQYVNNFRKIWADAPDDEYEELIREAKRAVASAVRIS
ncbi:endoplasmic oxidoreductin-1 [Fomitiporia mediterranea MF3/22]|uniref:endoplasmic oxidoreductin-1 n=1 Tax=Fomitiporia mediterranea (strain MF3/22) TaxID=694068 RepID=UPI000440884C|nr:endoplasmic oxidoreductin-1 [Fomitiporia mediterranea MF3/22]EJD02770.1 endoplasmic oxidoreductin-1 [Fomitiporia mediterranea MF3/22]